MLSVSKTFFICILCISFVSCSNDKTSSTNNSDTPSISETQNFISKKLKNYVGVMNRKQNIVFDGCLIKKVVGKSVTGGSESDNNFINLKYFNPEDIEIQEGSILFYTTGRQDIVYVDYNHGEHIDTLKYFDFEVSSPEYNMPKVKKAVQHMITICGGKGELF